MNLIPASDNLTRYCKTKMNLVTNERIIPSSSFGLRNSEEKSVSCNWIEFFNPLSFIDSINRIYETLKEKLNLEPKNKICILNISKAKEEISSKGIDLSKIKFAHDPSFFTKNEIQYGDDSHAGIFFDIELNSVISEALLETSKLSPIYDVSKFPYYPDLESH